MLQNHVWQIPEDQGVIVEGSLAQAAQDYHIVAQAIHYLDAHFQRQPGLAEVAAHVGLSEYHFQRLFSRWVGISPKRFLQYLTKEYAKAALDRSRSLLDVSLDAGLSGPGRLHDLFVHCEAVTPGEYKSAGEGLTIHYGVHPTPFGEALLATTDKGICALNFVAGDGSPELAAQQARWRSARFVRDDRETGRLIEAIFAPSSDPIPLHLYIRGTNWQIKVWEALLRLPSGARVTYGDIAQEVCTLKAARAVGNAVGSNPIAYLIPCHRVVRQSGGIHSYRWGGERKQAILAWEAAQTEKMRG
ncbi:MAG: methylated-DNA--[protein]-cysteine S-methyltransferase [Caldilineaceae bacterium]|nr:methylated-DNA--[protein]-cysteine S-methyltransferase [Caldilineaceae bacterium]